MQINKSGFFQSMVVMLGSTIGSGFSALAMILISRFLEPNQFGVFSVGFALSLILVRFTDFGLSYSIQKYVSQATKEASINALISYATRVKLSAMVVLMLVGLVVYRPIAELLHFSEPTIILLSFLLSGSTVLMEHFQAILQGLHRFAQSVLMTVIQAFVKLCGTILFIQFAHISVASLFSFYLLAPIVPVLFIRSWLPKIVKINLFNSFDQEKSLMKNMAIHSSIAFIVGGLIENLDILFVQHYLSSFETGLLAGVSKIAMLFSIIAYSLGTVLNPRVARYIKKQELKAYLRKATVVAALSVVGFLISIPFSGLAIELTIGSSYVAGTAVLIVLLASSFLTIAVIPFIALFFSYDQPYYFSISAILQLGVLILGHVILVPQFGLLGSAYTRLTARILLFMLTIIWALIYFKKQYDND